jgi:hypothetical protein
MAQRSDDVDKIAKLARALRPSDRARLIERVTADLERDAGLTGPRQSLRGLWADLGPEPSAEEIDAARCEAWQNFPHDLA